MIQNYLSKLSSSLNEENYKQINRLFLLLKDTINNNKNIFICGNGGSAANSIHIANDFIYLNNKLKKKKSIKVESLSSNTAIMFSK